MIAFGLGMETEKKIMRTRERDFGVKGEKRKVCFRIDFNISLITF